MSQIFTQISRPFDIFDRIADKSFPLAILALFTGCALIVGSLSLLSVIISLFISASPSEIFGTIKGITEMVVAFVLIGMLAVVLFKLYQTLPIRFWLKKPSSLSK